MAKLAYYNDIVVGAVCCRVDVVEKVKYFSVLAEFHSLKVSVTLAFCPVASQASTALLSHGPWLVLKNMEKYFSTNT